MLSHDEIKEYILPSTTNIAETPKYKVYGSWNDVR